VTEIFTPTAVGLPDGAELKGVGSGVQPTPNRLPTMIAGSSRLM